MGYHDLSLNICKSSSVILAAAVYRDIVRINRQTDRQTPVKTQPPRLSNNYRMLGLDTTVPWTKCDHSSFSRSRNR